jgi:hypothetical protein
MASKKSRYVRILPMAMWEFQNDTIDQIQIDYFCNKLPFERNGAFFFYKQGLKARPGTIVLFQYDNHIVAAARFVDQPPHYKVPRRYGGALIFEPASIRVFRPVSLYEIHSIWPEIDRFSRAKWKLDAAKYPRLEKILKDVRSPDALKPEEGAPEPSDDDAPYASDGIDRREVASRQIKARRGQGSFRNTLRNRFGDRCLVTGCQILDLLEAAHIAPYRGDPDNSPQNGLLLRADIHTLFDLDLLGIDPNDLTIHLHPKVRAEYGSIEGTALECKASIASCAANESVSRAAALTLYE